MFPFSCLTSSTELTTITITRVKWRPRQLCAHPGPSHTEFQPRLESWWSTSSKWLTVLKPTPWKPPPNKLWGSTKRIDSTKLSSKRLAHCGRRKPSKCRKPTQQHTQRKSTETKWTRRCSKRRRTPRKTNKHTRCEWFKNKLPMPPKQGGTLNLRKRGSPARKSWSASPKREETLLPEVRWLHREIKL